MSKAPAQPYIPNRLDWLARVTEPILEPGLPIVRMDDYRHSVVYLVSA